MTNALVLLSIGIFAFVYLRCLLVVIIGGQVRYRLTDLFALSTAVGLLAAAGYVWDTLTFGLLVVYAAISGPFWKRLVGRWATNIRTITVATSAAIVGSYFALLAVVSMLVIVFDQNAYTSYATVAWALASSGYISMEYIWHDEADTATQYFLYALPFGLVVNVIVGLFVGVILGLFARMAATICPQNRSDGVRRP